MTEQTKQEDFNFTTAVIVSHADIMTAKPFMKNGKPQGEPKYAGTFIVAPDNADLKRLKTEVTAMLAAKHPGKKLISRRMTQEEMDSGNCVEVQVPWKDGTREADKAKAAGKDREVYRGHVLVKASSKYPPALAVIENGKIVEYASEEARPKAAKFFYSGAYIVPSVGLHWYKGDEGKPDGVSLYFNAALFVKNGPRLGGGARDAASTFKGYLGSISSENPEGAAAAELDDEIPF